MIRTLKNLGIGLIAALVMSAVVASGASAAEFHAEQAHTILYGTQVTVNKFTTSLGAIECKKAEFHGTTTATTQTSVTLEPTYNECTAFGKPATITMNGCAYVFTVTLKPSEANIVHIECPKTFPNAPTVEHEGVETTVIEVHVPGFCTLTIPPQTPTGGGVSYQNEGTGSSRDVLLTWASEKIHYTAHNDLCLFLLGGNTNTTFTDMKITGSVTVRGKTTAGSPAGFWVE